MSFLRHREPHQADEQLKSSELSDERARPFGHALAHPADESPVGYSWRVALQHCPLPLHQPRLIVSKRSVEGNNFFDPVRLWLNFLSHSWGAVHLETPSAEARWYLEDASHNILGFLKISMIDSATLKARSADSRFTRMLERSIL